jgi:phosphate-selective porin OprO/OprP
MDVKHWHWKACAVLGAALPLTATALAQEAITAEQFEALQQRLDQQEREIRVLRSQVISLPAVDGTTGFATTSLPPVETAPPPAPDVGETDERLKAIEKDLKKITDAEKKKKADDALKPTIKVLGRIQADMAAFSQDPENIAAVGDIENGADFRRARIGATGKAFEITEYMFEMDIAGGSPRFTDVYMQVIELPFFQTLRAGHFKEPFSLEEITGDNYTTFMERGLPNAFSPARNFGIASLTTSDSENATFAYGVFRTGSDDFGDDVGDDGEQSFTMRGTWLPYYDEPTDGRYLFHVGASYSYRDADEGLSRFSSRPEIRMAAAGEGSVPNFVDTGDLPTEFFQPFGLETAWVNGPLSVQAEWIGNSVELTSGDNVFFHGAYAYASYFLTGESRAYRRSTGSFDRVKPYENFFLVRDDHGNICHGRGAWEIAFRWSYIDLNDAAIDGGQLHDLTLGLNWYLHPYMLLRFNFINAFLDDPALGDSDCQIYAMRFQFDW